MSSTRRRFLQAGTFAAMNLSGFAAEYDRYDATGLADLIARKQVTPLELLNAVRRRTEALHPRLNAFCHLFFDKAEAQIAALSNGPFRGVPFALKDIAQHLNGTVTSYGSRVFRNAISTSDSTYVERLKRAGFVLFAKTNTPEFGLAFTTESAAYGATHNPWNLALTSGGSSGGTSAAVAARILPAAHATDGGGSIRVPAACCGLFGLKPTRGRVPMGPNQFEGWNGLSCNHVITVSVRDSAAILDATAGSELGSPFFSPAPDKPFLTESRTPPGKLRIALCLDTPFGTPLHPECRKATVDAARLCENLGHVVEARKLPLDHAAILAARLAVIRVSIARTLDDAAANRSRPITEEELEPVTWDMYQTGRRVPVLDYSRAIAQLHQTGLAMARFQENFDVILSPVLGKPPVPLGVLALANTDLARFGKETAEFSPYTALQNVTGQPSMSVPLHWTSDGLPVGVMFSARFGDEATLFRLAAQLEKAKPWANHRPALV